MLERAQPPQRRVLRFYGASESEIARALQEAGGEGDGVTATICAREFEIHVDLIVEAGAEERAEELATSLRERAGKHLFTEDERPVEALVLEACRTRGLTLVTAESCTGGLVAARLTSVPGSSDVFVGAVVAYADAVKAAELGVPTSVLQRYGAVSAEVAAAMAAGAREGLRADVAVAVTGVAGPGGGTKQKPVGLVYLHAEGPDGSLAQELNLPGEREAIRQRAAVAGAPSGAHASGTKSSRRRMSLPASVEGSERLRLFCALRLPHETAERLTAWQREALAGVPEIRPLAARAPAPHACVPRPPAGGRARAQSSGPCARQPHVRSRRFSACAGTARPGASACSPSTTRTAAQRRSRSISTTGLLRSASTTPSVGNGSRT